MVEARARCGAQRRRGSPLTTRGASLDRPKPGQLRHSCEAPGTECLALPGGTVSTGQHGRRRPPGPTVVTGCLQRRPGMREQPRQQPGRRNQARGDRVQSDTAQAVVGRPPARRPQMLPADVWG
jgi:hypothetical protein